MSGAERLSRCLALSRARPCLRSRWPHRDAAWHGEIRRRGAHLAGTILHLSSRRGERERDEQRPSSGKRDMLCRAEFCEITAALQFATKGRRDSRVSRSSPVCLATAALERCRSRPYYRGLPEQNDTCLVNAELQRRTNVMKHLLTGVAIVAALAFAAPVWAQRTGPGPAAGTGTGPGVTPPGGLGPSSPLSNLPGPGAPGYAPPPTGTYYPAGAAPGMAPGMAPGPEATTSATPPAHRHARASTHHHGMAAHPPSAMSGTTANQLNQEEFARVAAGNFSMPPAPPGPEPSASNPEVGAGRAARRARQ